MHVAQLLTFLRISEAVPSLRWSCPGNRAEAYPMAHSNKTATLDSSRSLENRVLRRVPVLQYYWNGPYKEQHRRGGTASAECASGLSCPAGLVARFPFCLARHSPGDARFGITRQGCPDRCSAGPGRGPRRNLPRPSRQFSSGWYNARAAVQQLASRLIHVPQTSACLTLFAPTRPATNPGVTP